MKKSVFAFGAISIAAFGLVACGDNSSSSTAYELNIGTATSSGPAYGVVVPDTILTLDTLLHSYFCNSAIKCSHVYLVEMDNVMECDGEAWVYLSDYQPSVCGYEPGKPNSSASVENPGDALSSSSSIVEEPEACVEHVQANITIKNVEHIVMDCGSSNVGQTVYLEDTQTLYTCENGAWIGERVAVCEEPEPSQPVEDVPSVSYGTMTDERDGQTYKTIEIGKQTWMAENLNYESSTSYCYQNSLDSCDKYGRLYTYNEADTVCPDGYRLPTRMDFDNLLRPLSEAVYDERLDWHYNLIELSIKATTDWVPDTTTYVNENGELVHQADATNSSGFTLLPAGYMKPNGSFSGAGKDTYLWSSADGPEAGTKYAMELEYRYDGVTFYWWELDYAFSVRCVKE